MTITFPAHPQILLALGNSQSMDGDLSGAIRTGSGRFRIRCFTRRVSPVNFTIPTGFTPPVEPRRGRRCALYGELWRVTLTTTPTSRLNVAKAGFSAILTAYIANADFGLIDYQLDLRVYAFTTWVYQMSTPGGFIFTSIPRRRRAASTCRILATTSISRCRFPTSQDCTVLNSYYGDPEHYDSLYMLVSASSDDPGGNDVLYARRLCRSGVYHLWHGLSRRRNPLPIRTAWAAYEGGGVFESYSSESMAAGA